MYQYPEDMPRRQVELLAECYGQLGGIAFSVSDPRGYLEFSDGSSTKTRLKRVQARLKEITVQNDIEEIVKSLRNFPSQAEAAVIHSHCMMMQTVLGQRLIDWENI